MYKMIVNQKDSIPLEKIYAIEKKKWGTIWVRYTDEKGVKKISVTREKFRDFCMKVQLQRASNRITSELIMRDES